MPDSLDPRFFLEPHQPRHRRYEALRAVFVDHQPQVEGAKRWGSPYTTLRRLGSAFRAQYRADQVPPFSCPRCVGGLLGSALAPPASVQTMRSALMGVVSR